MAITVTHLTTAGSTTNGTTYTTASVEMPADTLILIPVSAEAGTPAAPTGVASTSVTFTKLDDGVDDGAGLGRISLWGAIPSSTVTETITHTFGSNRANCVWSVVRIDGADTSGTVANALAQIVTAASSGQDEAASATLAAFANAANRAFAGFYLSQQSVTLTAGTDFTIIGQAAPGESHSLASEWRSDAEDTGPDVSWTGVSHWAAIAAEVKAALDAARKLGYGGIANTKGARDFSGKAAAEQPPGEPPTGGKIDIISQHQIDTTVDLNAPNALHEWERQKHGSAWDLVGITASGVATFRHEGLERLNGYNFRARAVQSGVSQSYLDIGTAKTFAAPSALFLRRR